MNSTHELWSVKEVAQTLRKINNCDKLKKFEYADATSEECPCSMESMCDTCIDLMAGLLEWSEDLEEGVNQTVLIS